MYSKYFKQPNIKYAAQCITFSIPAVFKYMFFSCMSSTLRGILNCCIYLSNLTPFVAKPENVSRQSPLESSDKPRLVDETSKPPQHFQPLNLSNRPRLLDSLFKLVDCQCVKQIVTNINLNIFFEQILQKKMICCKHRLRFSKNVRYLNLTGLQIYCIQK